MATQNGIYETATGDLLSASTGPMTAGAGETLRSDAPDPAKVRGDTDETNMHRWNGSAWVEVAQPAAIIPLQRVATGTTTQRDQNTPFTGALWCNTTTDQLEQYVGAAWGAVGAASDGWETLQQQVVTDQATVDFATAEHFTDYPAIRLRFYGVNSSTDNTTLILRFFIAAWKTAGYAYRGEARRGSASEIFSNNSGNGINVIDSTSYRMGTAAGEFYDGIIDLGDPSSTAQHKNCKFECWGTGQNGQAGVLQDGGGGLADAGAITKLRLLASGGDLSGVFVLQGNKLV